MTEPDGHRHASGLWIVEAGTWRPLHRIAVGRGPHEVAIAPDARFAYTADYGVYPEPHDAPNAPIPAGPDHFDATQNALRIEIGGSGQVAQFVFPEAGGPATGVRLAGHLFSRTED